MPTTTSDRYAEASLLLSLILGDFRCWLYYNFPQGVDMSVVTAQKRTRTLRPTVVKPGLPLSPLSPYNFRLSAMSSLLANCGVSCIRTLVMITGGVAVDALKADVNALTKLKGVDIPRSVRWAMVNALAKSSWFALLGVFR